MVKDEAPVVFNLAAARERCEAATPGPLKIEEDEATLSGYCLQSPEFWLGIFNLEEDAVFFAHARSDLPAALEALEEAQGKVERLRDHHALYCACGTLTAAILGEGE